jgi:hypothetical protein
MRKFYDSYFSESAPACQTAFVILTQEGCPFDLLFFSLLRKGSEIWGLQKHPAGVDLEWERFSTSDNSLSTILERT